ncbi:MAG: carboxypeptidase-like regulatory domain-containing protein [Ferruginibacter sp.]
MLIQLKKNFYLPLIALIAVGIFFSCKKDIDQTTTTNPPPVETPDLTTKVNASVSGFVIDETNAPVQGAEVKAGTAMPVTTDQYGYFEIKNTDVVKTAAFVTVSKAGYFKGIKTWGATAGKSAFFRIKLMTKTIAGTVDAAAGGNVTLPGGLAIGLPAGGVVVALNNAAYTGSVNVAVKWLNPEAADLTETMPGDLRGLDDAGTMKGLTTFGMAAVELTNASGELLQVASGKKATITMPLSSLLSASAPTTIPLWYFDESNGLWKQEGSATKTGNSYVGEVSHFSFWNCDLPNATVPLTFTVVDGNGNPVANAHVEIVPTTSNSWSHIGGFTDPTGYVSVFVTPDNSYSLEIYSSCNFWGGTPDYSTTFSVTNVAVDLGNITVATSSSANITGTITDCNGSPVTNGHIIVQNGYYFTSYSVDNTGSYNFNMILCNGTTAVTLIAEDVSASQQSTPMPYTLVAGANVVGNMVACGVNTTQFIHYSVDGGLTFHDFTAPGDSLTLHGDPSSNTSYIFGNSFNLPAPPGSNIAITFDNTGLAAGSIQNLLAFSASAIPDQTVVTNPISINVTEYGPVGGYFAGNFAGIVTGSAPPNTPYSIICTFRVKRYF